MLDMAGYAAAVTHRGVRVVRLPTTVLSQDDVGVSVKNGVNGYGRKNYFGTFSPPFAVINDTRFLATLSRRDTIAGMSEAVKAALIRDAEFFGWILDHADRLFNGNMEDLSVLVRWSAALHVTHLPTAATPSNRAMQDRSISGIGPLTSWKRSANMHCGTARRSRSASRSTRCTPAAPVS